ncbi:hypothetical protein BZG36_04747 [Bifiguratus adelaidae]|uniref:Uncharacterized protein n=1 Tax=Bifiguratus adelaidae TaxID=1938954 RepID=A0A261XV05_9FUNG|nr:hypothetical protein BZG36_04747 [Bifiguratus adelaidae]
MPSDPSIANAIVYIGEGLAHVPHQVPLNSPGFTLAEAASTPAIDKLCELGVTGNIAFQRSKAASGANVFAQLLGIGIDNEGTQAVDLLHQRFGNMRIQVVTNDPHVNAFLNNLAIPVRNYPSAQELAEICLNFANANTDPKSDIMLVHMKPQETSVDESIKLLQALDTAVATVIDAPKTFKAVVMTGHQGSSTTIESASLAPSLQSLRPQQSFQIKEGQICEVDDSLSLACAAYYHPTATRRDTVSRFSENEIGTTGGNGVILAWHFMPEIAFKLGYVPKYGA